MTAELEKKIRTQRNLWWQVATGSLALAAAGVVLARWGPVSDTLAIGTLDGWVAGAASILAVCIALWTVTEARSDRIIERDDDVARMQRSEAESVLAAFQPQGKHSQPTIYNYGERPIRNVRVRSWPRSAEGEELRGGASYPLELTCSQVAPGASYQMPETSYVRADEVDRERSSFEYSFEDIFGTLWTRSTDGSLASERHD